MKTYFVHHPQELKPRQLLTLSGDDVKLLKPDLAAQGLELRLITEIELKLMKALDVDPLECEIQTDISNE